MSAAPSVAHRIRTTDAAMRRLRVELRRIRAIQSELTCLFSITAAEQLQVSETLVAEAMRWKGVERATEGALDATRRVLDEMSRQRITARQDAQVSGDDQPLQPCPRCGKPAALTACQAEQGHTCESALCDRGVGWYDDDRVQILREADRLLRQESCLEPGTAISQAIDAVRDQT